MYSAFKPLWIGHVLREPAHYYAGGFPCLVVIFTMWRHAYWGLTWGVRDGKVANAPCLQLKPPKLQGLLKLTKLVTFQPFWRV